MKSMLGGQQAPADYAPLPGGDFDDLGANPRARASRFRPQIEPSARARVYLRWASRRRCRGAFGMSRPPTPPRATTNSLRTTFASNRRRAKSSGSPSRAPTPPICRARLQRFSLRRVLTSLASPHRPPPPFRRDPPARFRGGVDEHVDVDAPPTFPTLRGPQPHRVLPQVREPTRHPPWRAHGGVRQLRPGHLPGCQRRIPGRRDVPRGRRAPSPSDAPSPSRIRTATRRPDGEVPAVRGAPSAAARSEPRHLRRVPPGYRHARRRRRRSRGGTPGTSATHRVPLVLHAVAASSGGAAGGVWRVPTGDAGSRSRRVARRERTRAVGGSIVNLRPSPRPRRSFSFRVGCVRDDDDNGTIRL